MAEKTEDLTYRQLADRLGLSLDAARARVRRGKWLKITDNHGTVRVSVPLSALNKSPEQDEPTTPDVHSVQESAFIPNGSPPTTHSDTVLSTLRDMLATLQTELDARRQEATEYREENATLREQNAQLRERLAKMEGERDHSTSTHDVHPVQKPVFTLNGYPEQSKVSGGYVRRRRWWPFG